MFDKEGSDRMPDLEKVRTLAKDLTKTILAARGKCWEVMSSARVARINACLLYTSDAAAERSSVDLGGRRILKKKNNRHDNV